MPRFLQIWPRSLFKWVPASFGHDPLVLEKVLLSDKIRDLRFICIFHATELKPQVLQGTLVSLNGRHYLENIRCDTD